MTNDKEPKRKVLEGIFFLEGEIFDDAPDFQEAPYCIQTSGGFVKNFMDEFNLGYVRITIEEIEPPNVRAIQKVNFFVHIDPWRTQAELGSKTRFIIYCDSCTQAQSEDTADLLATLCKTLKWGVVEDEVYCEDCFRAECRDQNLPYPY